jgi:hypothetical protein
VLPVLARAAQGARALVGWRGETAGTIPLLLKALMEDALPTKG